MSDVNDGRKGRRGWVSQAELEAYLATNEEVRARLAQQAAEHAKRVKERMAEFAPIMDELRAAGCRLDSVNDLVSERLGPCFDVARPILLKHLDLPHTPYVRETLARAFGRPAASVVWYELRRRYVSEKEPAAKEGLAVALQESYRAEFFDDLVELLRDPANGESRILLLRALGKSRRSEARAVLDALADDPDLRKQIRFMRRLKRWRIEEQ